MRLLVSVRDAVEAAAALAGGADIIDAKEPSAGALGAVAVDTFRDICSAVGSHRPVSAALGDDADEHAVERAARESAQAGAAFVKVGFLSAGAVDPLLAAAVRGASAAACGVIGVAYVDSPVDCAAVLNAVAHAGASGILLDTADKRGPGLRQWMTAAMLARLVADAHDAGLLVAVAGKLTADDLPFVADSGADIAGIRSAACVGGRTGPVSAECVRVLVTRRAGLQACARRT